MVKDIERRLESVRKERDGIISILKDSILRKYESEYKHFSNRMQNVGVKMYGSMASGLAIDSSDVDLAVVGLNFNGNRETLV